jgi:hypothetical protein
MRANYSRIDIDEKGVSKEEVVLGREGNGGITEGSCQ